jgi:NitT/TauT family transport system substrate-binding protein
VHIGCFELFGTDRVRTLRNLNGKTLAVQELGSSQHAFLASMASYVGLDPAKDISWVTHPLAEVMRLLPQGRSTPFWALRWTHKSSGRRRSDA